jgi:CBS domain containing-hemolysin-like protein
MSFSSLPLCSAAMEGVGGLTEWHFTASELFWQSLIVLFIVVLNAFFVAAEFAIVKVRQTQLEAAEAEGESRARFAQKVTRNLDAYLSAGQLGITLTSIALGIFGEPFVATVVQPLLFKVGITSASAVKMTSVGVAYAVVTYLHVVLGEQTPKVLAIRKSLATALWIARPLHLFYLILKPAIYVLNASTNFVLRFLFRVNPVSENELAHSEEELRHIVAESQKSKEVTETEKDILLNALGLNDRCVRDVMTPRNQVISLDLEDDFSTNLKRAIDQKHTRYPLVEGHLDQSQGMIHIKDMLALTCQPQPDLKKIRRELPMVPEMMPIDKLLRFFLDKHAHIALAVDEYGGAVGIVTLDNVLEEIVGDIQDEFDHDISEFRRVSDTEFITEGTLNLHDLRENTGLELDNDEVSTIGGYVTHKLGHLPKVGESTEIEGYQVTIIKADARRVQQLRFQKSSALESADEA